MRDALPLCSAVEEVPVCADLTLESADVGLKMCDLHFALRQILVDIFQLVLQPRDLVLVFVDDNLVLFFQLPVTALPLVKLR